MAYKKIQIKRGTKNGMPNLRSGEPGFTQDEHSFYIGTGATNKRFLNEEQTKVELDKKVMKTIYDEKINGIDLKNNNQDSEIQLIKNKNIEQDNKLIQLEEKNIELDTNLDNKVKLDGESKSNFNFIGNELVQDGLVSTNPISFQLSTIIPNKQDLTYWIPCTYGIWGSGNNMALRITYYYTSNSIALRIIKGLEETKSTFILGIGVNKIDAYASYDQQSGDMSFTVNGETKVINFDTTGYTYSANIDELIPVYKYNRILLSTEIQHNFSVLNNPQSISHLETTSSDGTKVKHLFHSDSQVVSMRDERTLNEFANEVLDWEEKIADATGKIEVGNCKRAWLRNFSVEGQTVKNVHEFRENMIVDDTSSNNQTFPTKKIETTKNTKYTAIFNVLEMESQCSLSIRISQGVQYLSNVKLGINTITFTTGLDDVSYNPGYLKVNESGKTVKIAWFNLIEGDIVNIASYIPFGLSSTQAIISNNGMKSVFEMVNKEGVKEVIELSKVGDVADTLTLNEDGSGLWTQNIFEEDFSEVFYSYQDIDKSNLNKNYVARYSKKFIKNEKYELECNNIMRTQNLGSMRDSGLLGIISYTDGNSTHNTLYISLSWEQSGIVESDGLLERVAKVKKWMNDNKTVVLIRNTPITTHIPKELIPTIATQQTNNLSVDSPVQPSSFKATVPVDKVAVLEKELARIASIVDTPKNVTLLDNYVEDEYNKNQKENQTIKGVM